jgi:hypothetical protein
MAEYTGRTTFYHGIKMRSRLEAAFAVLLDRLGHEWQYEPYALNTANKTWLPDFSVPRGLEGPGFSVDGGFSNWYVELKPSGFAGPTVGDLLDTFNRIRECAFSNDADAVVELRTMQWVQRPNRMDGRYLTSHRLIGVNDSVMHDSIRWFDGSFISCHTGRKPRWFHRAMTAEDLEWLKQQERENDMA